MYKQRVYDLQTSVQIPTIDTLLDSKAFYSDSTIIGENLKMFISDSFGKETRKVIVNYYTFIDLRSRTFYLYKFLSDTAKPFRVYKQERDGPSEDGWKFFDTVRSFNGELSVLPDTLITRSRYKRIIASSKVVIDNDTLISRVIGYVNCNAPVKFFFIDKKMSEQTGCPITMVEFKHRFEPRRIFSKIEWVSEQLPDSVRRVFAAWKRNTESHPAPKSS